MPRNIKVNLSLEEWESLANKLKASMNAMSEVYDMLIKTASIQKCDSLHRVRVRGTCARLKIAAIMAKQHGWEKADKLFHGNGWCHFS